MTKYKAVPMGVIHAKHNSDPAEALGQVAQLIGSEAVGGWKFMNMYHMPVYVDPGCIDSCRGKHGSVVYLYLLIFVMEE